MNPLTGAADEAWISTPALRVPARSRKRSLADALADPQVRLGAGAAALLVTAVAVRRDRVGRCEAAAFRAVNGLPSSLCAPAWAVMQLGTLGAAPAAAAVAWLAGDRELAGRLLAGGTGTWALSKVFKHVVRRPRPAALIPETRVRGREAAGLGYLSGHAGVAIALGAAAFPHLGRAGRAVTLTAVPVVGLARMYVGAHLPLDVAGGAALGLVVEAAATVGAAAAAKAQSRCSRTKPRTASRSGLSWSVTILGSDAADTMRSGTPWSTASLAAHSTARSNSSEPSRGGPDGSGGHRWSSST